MKITAYAKEYSVTYQLEGEALQKTQEVAAEFDLELVDFVTRYATAFSTLPGQEDRHQPWPDDPEMCAEIARLIEKRQPVAFARIKRAASLGYDGEDGTPGDFIWHSVLSSVECAEDDMLLSPKTGTVVADRLHFDLDRCEVSRRFNGRTNESRRSAF